MPKVLPKSCPDKCGNLTIPFPFGIGKHCYLDETFGVECNKSSNSTSLIYSFRGGLNDGMKFKEISLLGYATVNGGAFPTCYNNSGGFSGVFLFGSGSVGYFVDNPFTISYVRNKFVGLGCDIYAYVQDNEDMPLTIGCASFCDNPNKSNPTSTGRGYCETALPRTIDGFRVGVYSVNTLTRGWTKNPCNNYAFIVDKKFSKFDQFNNTFSNYSALENMYDDIPVIPVVLDWWVGNISCHEASKRKDYLCSRNAECTDGNATGTGYNCHCRQGYRGNPYLSEGCQDIDECKDPKKNKCKDNAICNNTPGSYTCTCPVGYNSYNLANDGLRCVPGQGHQFSPRTLLLGVGIATIVLILIALGFWLYRHFERRKKIRIKQKFFKRNGGLLFQQQVSSSEGSVMKTKLFEAQELEKATDNFNRSRVLGKGGLGTVYKGMLQDGSIVAVKKSNMINENQVGQFINEVSILLQIDHRNIVKLLGCCLETEVPLLVYEYVSNGTLSHHLHDEGCVSTMSWENRLRIAKEVAGALAYLHSYASTSIFHRDIKSANILLDENFRAVVSDFGLSRSVSIEKTHLTTVVGGTFGYLDPEYFRSGQFTDKSDVYAFGVVLAELLTGVKAVSLDVSKLGLVMYLQSSMKQNRLFEILDPLVVKEGLKEEILVVAKLAKRCLKLNAKKRPSMREVAADLDRLARKQIQPSHELICHEKYQSESESSYSYATDGISEDCSNPSLVFPNHIA